jgi:transcriptional regulator with XRE-family HTH domain
MGRHPTRVTALATGHRRGPKWPDPYWIEWGVVVGDRVRRLRRDAGFTLVTLAQEVMRPEGGHYSPGYFSRLERGWTTAPLYVYVAIAAVLDVEPGRLLGPDAAQLEANEAEMTLVRLIRRLEIEPAAAIARLVRPGEPR